MNRVDMKSGLGEHRGIRIGPRENGGDLAGEVSRLRALLGELGLCSHTQLIVAGESVVARLRPESARLWAPALDTTQLAARLRSDIACDERHLERETLVGLLLSPIELDFPDFDEFDSSRAIRTATAQAAERTALCFDVEQFRPEAYWQRNDSGSFTLREECGLVQGLCAATQPGPGEPTYGFGCYRASEYVMLLAIAGEAARCNPVLKQRLRERSRRRPIESREFHEALLRELGTFDEPLPAHWFVPGDRVWFRNPDEHSADAEGYEGSWVIYMGGGLFSNFWKRDAPFTLARKCVEIFHWRNATYRDDAGALRVNEEDVARRVAETEADPVEWRRVMERMSRWRDARGVYAEGGCMDRTRECARWVRPETCDIAFALS